MPLVGVKAPDAVEGTEASVPTLGVKGFWPWAFLGCRNTSLAPAAVLFPVRAKPRPAPAPITARITRPIRTRLPVSHDPPASAHPRRPWRRAKGLATPCSEWRRDEPRVVGSPEEADGRGESGSVGGGDAEGPAAAEECPSRGLLGLELLFAEDTVVAESDEPFELLSRADVTPRLPGLANDTGVAGNVCRRECHVNCG